MLLSSADWLIFLSVWSFKVHLCGYRWHKFIISLFFWGGWIIIHCICLLRLEAFICRWRFCWFYLVYCKKWGSACWGAYVVLNDGFLGIIVAGVGMLDFSFSSLDRFFSWHTETVQRLLPLTVQRCSLSFRLCCVCFLWTCEDGHSHWWDLTSC